MNARSASEARTNLYRLMDETASSHQPVLISGKRNNAALIGADDWKAGGRPHGCILEMVQLSSSIFLSLATLVQRSMSDLMKD
jgi:hypothetical protein